MKEKRQIGKRKEEGKGRLLCVYVPISERKKKKKILLRIFCFSIHFNGNNQMLLQMYSSLGNKIQYVQEVLPHFAQ